MLRPRSARRDLLALAALCAVTYFLGLTTHGLTNWQESMRALVAREMLDRGEWLVPTVAGRPYLAKPPMFYWLQMALAKLLGGRSGELELRLAVALSGLAGVVLTYFAAARLLRPAGEEGLHPACADPHWARSVGWWSAACLGTGVLYVRSSRIGELDILQAPFVVAGVWALAEAWRQPRRAARWAWVALACAAAAGASLTKGPPAVMVMALAAYGGMLLEAAALPAPSPRWARRATVGAGAAAAAVAVALSACRAANPGEWVAAAWFGLFAAGAAALLGRLAHPRRAARAWGSLSRTHPVAVVGAGVLALWLWGRTVRARVADPGVVSGAASVEAADNLALFSLESPLNSLEAVSYGVGLGSAAAMAACVWLLRDRPRLPRAWVMVLGWVFLSLAAFSVLGRGTLRYLTPVWPGVAMLGGAWLVAAIDRLRGGRRLAMAAGAAVVGLAVGQAWWYGWGRERYFAHRSPRAFMGELLRPETGVDRRRVYALDFWEPSLDYYADAHVEPVEFDGPKIDWPGPKKPLAELREEIRRTEGSVTILLRATPAPGRDGDPPLQRLTRAGFGDAPFMVQTIPIEARYLIDRRRTRVIAVRVFVPDHVGY